MPHRPPVHPPWAPLPPGKNNEMEMENGSVRNNGWDMANGSIIPLLVVVMTNNHHPFQGK